MAFRRLQDADEEVRNEIFSAITNYITNFKPNSGTIEDESQGDHLKFKFSNGGLNAIFQCMQNDGINSQGSVCLHDNENGQVKILFARKMKFSKVRMLNESDGEFIENNLRKHFENIVVFSNEEWEKESIQNEEDIASARFVLFELDGLDNGQNTSYEIFEARLNAFLRTQKYLRAKKEEETNGTQGDEEGRKMILNKSMMAAIESALTAYRNIILEGVPGTGKTWYARKLSAPPEKGAQQGGEKFVARWITFHPAVAYEDFVEGIRPGADRSNAMVGRRWFWENGGVGDGGGFAVRDGFFLRVCQEACRNPLQNYLIVIDEINRANLPNVLGDLLTLLEKDKRVTFPEPGEAFEPNDDSWVTLPYSGRRFAVPANVYVLGTMNTSDKSIAPIDAALRRRFAFLTIEPMSADALRDKVQEDVHNSVDHWAALNGLLADCLGPDGRLGHSYLLQLSERIKFPENNGSKEVVKSIASTEAIRLAWQLELLPQLIDTLTTHGAIELFAADDGRAWLGARGQQTNDGHEVIKTFRGFINSLGFDLVLQGDGHGKGLRVVPTGTETDEPAASAAFAEAAE